MKRCVNETETGTETETEKNCGNQSVTSNSCERKKFIRTLSSSREAIRYTLDSPMTHYNHYEHEHKQERRTGYNDFLDIPVLVNPLTDVKALNSGLTNGCIMINIRKGPGIMTLQWEPFSGQAGGVIDHLTINSTVCNLPTGNVQFPIRLKQNAINKMGYFEIDPTSPTEKLKFYFDINNASVAQGDMIIIYGSTISWTI